MKIRFFSVILTATLSIPAFAQSGGDLTPPAGVPSKSMKSLDEVEARTAISSVPATITEPGSYYLTKNVATGGGTGITIQVSNVTLDLNGFTLDAPGGTNSNSGIFVKHTSGGQLENITIKNGTIRGFAVSLGLSRVNRSVIKDLTCRGSDNCIFIDGDSGESNGNLINGCTLSSTSGTGILLEAGTGGECSGNVVRDCAVTEANTGVSLSGSGGECNGNIITRTTIFGTTSGIRLNGNGGECNGNQFALVTVNNITSTGISISGTSSGQCNGNIFDKCSVSNGTGGFCVGLSLNGNGGSCSGNSASGCRFTNLSGYGIRIQGAGSIGNKFYRNTVNAATTFGIRIEAGSGNLLEGNQVTSLQSASKGFDVAGSNNLVIKNLCIGTPDNFSIAAANTSGPEITASGTLASTGTPAHPWANFSLNEAP